jgi:hypothetical protein
MSDDTEIVEDPEKSCGQMRRSMGIVGQDDVVEQLLIAIFLPGHATRQGSLELLENAAREHLR